MGSVWRPQWRKLAQKAPKTPQPASDEDPFVKARLVIAKVLEVDRKGLIDVKYTESGVLAPRISPELVTKVGLAMDASTDAGKVKKGDKVVVKPANFGQHVVCHQDWAFYPHTNDSLVTVGIPLDDMSEENGGLSFLLAAQKA